MLKYVAAIALLLASFSPASASAAVPAAAIPPLAECAKVIDVPYAATDRYYRKGVQSFASMACKGGIAGTFYPVYHVCIRIQKYYSDGGWSNVTDYSCGPLKAGGLKASRLTWFGSCARMGYGTYRTRARYVWESLKTYVTYRVSAKAHVCRNESIA